MERVKKILLIAVISYIVILTECGNTDIIPSDQPKAVLKLPSVSLVNTSVLFDASASIDKDGQIVLFIFAINDEKPFFFQNNPKLIYTFDKTGKYQVSLEIYDNDGYSDKTVRTINIVDQLLVPTVTEGMDYEIFETDY